MQAAKQRLQQFCTFMFLHYCMTLDTTNPISFTKLGTAWQMKEKQCLKAKEIELHVLARPVFSVFPRLKYSV